MPSKKNSIALQEYVSSFSLKPGETVRYNHRGCPAGEDTRQRLYITRPEESNGVYLGYCHNCGNSGILGRYSFSKGFYRGGYRDDISSLVSKEDTVPSVQGLISFKEWESERLHIGGTPSFYNVADKELLNFAHLKFNRVTNRWHLPVSVENVLAHGSTGEPWVWDTTFTYGYNERAMYLNQSPKYKLMVHGDFPGYSKYLHWCADQPSQHTYVLCEDQMSAINVVYAGATHSEELKSWVGVSLYGCANSVEKIHTLFSEAPANTRWVIWFDNDNAIVKQKAQDTYKYLNLLGVPSSNLRICHANKEPKKWFTGDLAIGLLSQFPS